MAQKNRREGRKAVAVSWRHRTPHLHYRDTTTAQARATTFHTPSFCLRRLYEGRGRKGKASLPTRGTSPRGQLRPWNSGFSLWRRQHTYLLFTTSALTWRTYTGQRAGSLQELLVASPAVPQHAISPTFLIPATIAYASCLRYLHLPALALAAALPLPTTLAYLLLPSASHAGLALPPSVSGLDVAIVGPHVVNGGGEE